MKKQQPSLIGGRDYGVTRHRLLLSRGVPGQDFPSARDSFDLEETLVSMDLSVPRTSDKRISSSRQLKNFLRIFENPLRGSYTLGISSFPSDARAKAVAIHLMNRAIDVHDAQRRAGRGLPIWHRVYGSLGDPLRDKPQADSPSLIVIANVDNDSSAVKIEKVRDLIAKYDVPKIIVSTGGQSCDLFANRLHCKCNYLLHVGPPNLVDRG